MGDPSLAPAKAPGKWGFNNPEMAAEAQGLIATGFMKLTSSAVLFLRIDETGPGPRGLDRQAQHHHRP